MIAPHGNDLIGTTDAARMLGTYADRVRQLVKNGRLSVAEMRGRRPKFHLADVQRLAGANDLFGDDASGQYVPTPEQIAAECRAIRAGWSRQEEDNRFRGIMPNGERPRPPRAYH